MHMGASDEQSQGVEIHGLQLSSNVVHDGDQSAPLYQPSIASPSPLQPTCKARRKKTTTRWHAILRQILSPFRTTRVRASASDDKASISNGEASAERGKTRRRRRRSLEELLKMEALPPNPELKAEPDMARYETAVVLFDTGKHHDVSCCDREEEEATPFCISKAKQRFDNDAMKPVEAVLGGAALSLWLSLMVRINIKRLVPPLRTEARQCKGSYWRLASRRAADKAELFYHRPIPLGRRCQVQHLEESPYL